MADWSEKTPLEWQAYINKEVKVTADEKYEYQGWVVTIDPVSASLVLATFSEDQKTQMRVVMGHAVQKVEVVNEIDDLIQGRLLHLFNLHETSTHSIKDLETKKQSLKNWLEQNGIPVTEQSDQTLCVAGVLTISPPYGPDNCSSTNEIILSRVQGLLKDCLASQKEVIQC
ncbi:gem-associated protein 6 [Gastrophryne carolinensis]